MLTRYRHGMMKSSQFMKMFSTGEILSPEKKETVVITGGAGFLGQHIVRHIQQHTANIGEVRILDIRPVRKFMDYDDIVPTKTIISDIENKTEVEEALRQADSVIHVAGLVSYSTFPDIAGMEAVNVQGTKNIIEACIKENVPRLIFCSTVDVVIGHDDIVNGDETLPVPDYFLFPGYPDTKHRAEKLVLEANGAKLNNGQRLSTIALRPNVMYGEGDPFYVTTALRNAKHNNRVLVRVGNGNAVFQQCYVGNVAWGFLCADTALRNNPSRVAGQCFFLPDDTPLRNTFAFMEPFLKDRKYRLSTFYLPWKFVYLSLYVLEMVLAALRPIYRVSLPTQSFSVKYINLNLYFSSVKSRQLLGYKPFYTQQEALSNSASFYKHVKL